MAHKQDIIKNKSAIKKTVQLILSIYTTISDMELCMKTMKFRNNFIFSNIDYSFNKQDKTILVKLGEYWRKLDTDGILSKNKIKCDNLMSFFNSNLKVINQNNKEGVIDNNFNVVIKPQYNNNAVVPYLYNENLMVYKPFKKDKTICHRPAILDLKGNIVINFKYDNLRVISLEPFLLIAEINKKCGVINLKEEVIIPFEYEDLKPCQNGNSEYLIARKGYSDFGIIDISNNIVIPFENSCQMRALSNETFIKSYDKFTHHENLIFDFNNNKVCDTEFKFINNPDTDSDIIGATIDFENWGYIDKFGNTVIDFKYKDVHDFVGNCAFAAKDLTERYHGLIDKNGNKILPFKFSFVQPYEMQSLNNGEMFVISQNQKYGIVDKKGNTVIDFIYDYIIESMGYFIVTYNNKCGVFNLDFTPLKIKGANL